MDSSQTCPIAAPFICQNRSMKRFRFPSILKTLKVSGIALLALGFPAMAQEQSATASGGNRAAAADEAATDDLSPLFKVSPIFQDGLTGYRTLDGDEFSLLRRGNETLFQVTGSREVWSLYSVQGPRGDEFLKNDTDRIFLRLTDLGGVILFDSENRHGMPVDPLIEPATISATVAEEDLANRLTAYISLRLGHHVKVSLDDSDPDIAAWIHDAAQNAAEGMIRSQEEAATITEVHVRRGSIPELDLSSDGILTVFVDPEAGFAGRPSSDRVIVFLKKRLAS